MSRGGGKRVNMRAAPLHTFEFSTCIVSKHAPCAPVIVDVQLLVELTSVTLTTLQEHSRIVSKSSTPATPPCFPSLPLAPVAIFHARVQTTCADQLSTVSDTVTHVLKRIA